MAKSQQPSSGFTAEGPPTDRLGWIKTDLSSLEIRLAELHESARQLRTMYRQAENALRRAVSNPPKRRAMGRKP